MGCSVARWWLLVPLLAALSALWWWGGGIGIMPGRSVLVLLAGAALAGSLRGGALPAGWHGPMPWLIGALLWQALSLNWSALPMAGAGIIAERMVALAAALGLLWRLGSAAAPVAVIAGAGILALDALAGPWLGPWIGMDPPFGNPNFNAAAAPLVVLGLARWRSAERSERIATVIGLLAIAALVGVHGTRSVLLIVPAGLLVLAVLRWLPSRTHLPLLGSGVLVLITMQILVAVHGVRGLPFSWEQRRHLWTAAVESCAAAPVIGHGAGSAITLLTAGSAADRAWLSVPSWPEHAHQEGLQIVLEGGLVNLALLSAALILTLLPMWRRRDQPEAQALLAAWAAVLVHALVESHLAQPGPLACIALLAAATWAASPPPTVTAETPSGALSVRFLMAVVGCMGLGLALADFKSGGSYPMIDRRARVALATAEADRDWARAAEIVAGLRTRVGPLDDLPLLAGRLQARLHAYPAATEFALEQAHRLPVVPGTLDLLRRLANRHVQRGERDLAAPLQAAWAEAAVRIQAALVAVPASSKSQAARDELIKELAVPPRSVAVPPSPPLATP